jgi:hypothetical protein
LTGKREYLQNGAMKGIIVLPKRWDGKRGKRKGETG